MTARTLTSHMPPWSAENPTTGTPPERDGKSRDGVRLMVAEADSRSITHTTFSHLGEFLVAGDVLVVNVSATIPASVDGTSLEHGEVRLHISSPISGGLWSVEPRHPLAVGSEPWRDFPGGEVVLPGGVKAQLLTPDSRSPRLWIADMETFGDVIDYLNHHGQPIRYTHVQRPWPLSDYQTVYAAEPGSAEMPSAGRPFTTHLITRLMASGVVFVPVVLHSGVASFEPGERPDSERFRIPEPSARLINQARRVGGRVIAVGTTTTRALETTTDGRGVVHPGSGITDLLITPDRGVRAIDGIITGWHEAGASHLELVESVAGRDVIESCYSQAVSNGYQWHEFGDSLLVMRNSVAREPRP